MHQGRRTQGAVAGAADLAVGCVAVAYDVARICCCTPGMFFWGGKGYGGVSILYVA